MRASLLLFRLAALALASGGCASGDRGLPPAPASILLILIDTLRADHLSAYGYPHPTSPALDRIAREGVLFRDCTSVCPWTNPTVAALFSGGAPRSVLPAVPWGQAIELALPPEVDTLAEILRREGLRTIALVDHPGIKQELRYDQGFDTFVRLFDKRGYHDWIGSPVEHVLADVTEELAGAGSSRFFCYVHVVYPHRPYLAPAAYRGLFASGAPEPLQRYDEEIRYADELVAGIAGALERAGRADDTMLIVTSDHGEGFLEHGREEHGNSFYEELLRVPLVIRAPRAWGWAPRVVADPVGLADLFPTVLAAAGVSVPGSAAGVSLLPALRAGSLGPGSRALFSESAHQRCIQGAACRRGRFKLVYEPVAAGPADGLETSRRELAAGEGCRLFDLAADPGERQDASARHPEEAAALRLLLAEHLEAAERARAARSAGRSPLPPSDEERLRALGYVR